MNLKQRIVSTIAAGALLFGATSGMALADSTAQTDTVVNVTCPVTSSVTVNVPTAFSVDAQHGATSATIEDGFQIVLDLTCNWNPLFLVSANIGTFQFTGGTPPVGTASSFPGGRLTLSNGTGSYSGVSNNNPLNGPLAGAPNVNPTLFPGNLTTTDVAITPSVAIILPKAAPGITTATWDGSLTNLPVNLAGGVYKAPLTVTLSVA